MGCKRGARVMARLAVAALALGWLILATWCVPGQAAPELPHKIRLGYGKTWTTPVLFLAQAKGLFEQQGVAVTWAHFDNPNQVIQGIAAGSLDAGVATTTHYLIGREKGVNSTAVTLLAGLTAGDITFLAARGSGINSVKDLRGKTIAINNYGGTFDLYLRYVLEKAKIDPQREAKIIEMPFPAIMKALLAKQLDAGGVPALFRTVADSQHRDTLQVVFDIKDIDVVKDRRNTLLLVVSRDYLRRQRAAVKAFLKAHLRAIALNQEDPQQTVSAWVNVAGQPMLKQSPLPAMPADGKIDPKTMQVDIDLLNRYGFLKQRPSAAEVVDHSLLEEVLAGR